MTRSPSGGFMNKKLHPAVAMVFAMGAFFATSVVFNLVFGIATLLHVDRFLGGFLQGIAGFAIFLLIFPFSLQATRSRARPQVVAFIGMILLTAIYVIAVRFNVVLLTHGLFPHIPGKEFRADVPSAWVGLAIVIAIFVFFAVGASRPEEHATQDARKAPHDWSEEAAELGEGIGEGITEQIHHLHH